MGVDLALFPLYVPDYWFASTKLDVNRESGLWDEILKLQSKVIPQPLYCCAGESKNGRNRIWGEVKEDDYGEKLRFVTAGDLVSLKDNESVQNCWKRKAVWAFLSEYPSDWQIVLYWS